MSEDSGKIEMGDEFVPRGLPTAYGNIYTVIGSPRIKGGRWITVARDAGGAVVSFREDEFERRFRKP